MPPSSHPKSRRLAWLGVGYLILLHGALVLVCLKTNFRLLSAKTLGLAPPEERSIDLYQRLLPWAEKARRLPPGAVAVVGDSMVTNLDPTALGEAAVVLGAGGVTLPVLSETSGILDLLGPASHIVVCAGVNDLKYREPEAVAADYIELLLSLPEGPRILCLSMMPFDEGVPPSHGRAFITNAEIAQVNRRMEEALIGLERITFADVQWAVMTPMGTPVPGVYRGDGWHLSQEGLNRLAAAIRSQL